MRPVGARETSAQVMRTHLAILFLVGSTLVGCAPAWHSGEEPSPLLHRVERAIVFGDVLHVQGGLNQVVAVTDYGVRVNSAVDSNGKHLVFRSCELFWAKELRFDVQLDPPSNGAQAVTLDLEFLTRSGCQRVQAQLPVQRDVQRDYRMGSDWTAAKQVGS